MIVLFSGGDNWHGAIIGSEAVYVFISTTPVSVVHNLFTYHIIAHYIELTRKKVCDVTFLQHWWI